MKIKINIILLLAVFAIAITSCNKDDEETISGTASLDIKMSASNSIKSITTYDSVNVEILQVSYHTSSDTNSTGGWIDLETIPGVYNLMDYVNDQVLLAFDSVMQPQVISQIRLLLGENNTVTDDGIVYELETPSGQTSGLKVQVHVQMEANASYQIMLDFDPEASVKKLGNDTYKLQPVIQSTVTQL